VGTSSISKRFPRIASASLQQLLPHLIETALKTWEASLEPLADPNLGLGRAGNNRDTSHPTTNSANKLTPTGDTAMHGSFFDWTLFEDYYYKQRKNRATFKISLQNCALHFE